MKVLRAQKSANRAAKLAAQQAKGGGGREDSSSSDSDVSRDSDYSDCGEDEFTTEDEENHRRLEASFREEALEDEGAFVQNAMMNFPPLEYASTVEIPQEVGQSNAQALIS